MSNCTYENSGSKTTDGNFNFETLFSKTQAQKKAKIVHIEDRDYFRGNLSGCDAAFYKGLDKARMYDIKNSENGIVVGEYIYRDRAAAEQSFRTVSIYADFTRKLKRSEYAKKCYDIFDEQVYFAIMKERHIYLLTTTNALSFKNGQTSVDEILREDEKMLLDDLYYELKWVF